MVDVFYSPRLTLCRAHHHIRDFESQINAFVYEKPWAVFVDNQRHELRLQFSKDLPPNLPCIVFDVANNLRATLDQCGYAASLASGRTNPKRAYFPFGDDLPGLDNNIVCRKICEHVPPEIVTLFRSFKPYKGGDDTLWALNKLCNTQKHCMLAPTVIGN